VIDLAPIRAGLDRIASVQTCTRPFRAAGPRIETQRLGEKTIVHNYGHGGSGWSLSWGSGALALRLVQATGARSLGVIGCGALGLTSALLAQRAGLSVRIYSKDLPQDAYSMRASGLWTPDSRIGDAAHAPAFASRWESMVRISHDAYQNQLDLPDSPVEWIDSYTLSDTPWNTRHAFANDEPAYAELADRITDLTPAPVTLQTGSHPFAQAYVQRHRTMMFNIGTYARQLMADFLRGGGGVVIRQFDSPGDLLTLPEPTLINATGYGARALFGDESIIPVRGQTARLMAQPEINYGLRTESLSMVPRRGGILVQTLGNAGDFNNDDVTPDRAAAEATVTQLATLVASTRRR
jgi:glycine/D-amino acid oxidase-like deaminating enzyme